MNLFTAQGLAKRLMKEHIQEEGWIFAWNNRKTEFGNCSYSSKTIALSRPLTETNTEEEVLDTILHEIAHAIVGPGMGHGSIWQLTAKGLGSNGLRTSKRARVSKPVKGICLKCEKVVAEAHRMGSRMRRSFHRACGPTEGKLVWKRGRHIL